MRWGEIAPNTERSVTRIGKSCAKSRLSARNCLEGGAGCANRAGRRPLERRAPVLKATANNTAGLTASWSRETAVAARGSRHGRSHSPDSHSRHRPDNPGNRNSGHSTGRKAGNSQPRPRLKLRTTKLRMRPKRPKPSISEVWEGKA